MLYTLVNTHRLVCLANPLKDHKCWCLAYIMLIKRLFIFQCVFFIKVVLHFHSCHKNNCGTVFMSYSMIFCQMLTTRYTMFSTYSINWHNLSRYNWIAIKSLTIVACCIHNFQFRCHTLIVRLCRGLTTAMQCLELHFRHLFICPFKMAQSVCCQRCSLCHSSAGLPICNRSFIHCWVIGMAFIDTNEVK